MWKTSPLGSFIQFFAGLKWYAGRCCGVSAAAGATPSAARNATTSRTTASGRRVGGRVLTSHDEPPRMTTLSSGSLDGYRRVGQEEGAASWDESGPHCGYRGCWPRWRGRLRNGPGPSSTEFGASDRVRGRIRLAVKKATRNRTSPRRSARAAHDGGVLTSKEVLNKTLTPTQFQTGYDEREVDDLLDNVAAALRYYEQGGRPGPQAPASPAPRSPLHVNEVSSRVRRAGGRRLPPRGDRDVALLRAGRSA